MKSVDEASATILEAFEPVGEERLPLLRALGRFTSRPIVARRDAPTFDNSAMDGYALRAADVASASPEHPARLPVQGESRAGGELPPPLQPGSATRIFTGAVMPEGADAVLLQEDAHRDDSHVEVRAPLRSGHNVRTRGSDFHAGAALLPAYALLGSGELALLAGQDMPTVHVLRAPRVAVLCTGDELREIGEPERPGSVVNSNAYALCAQILEAGGEPVLLPNVPDEQAAAVRAIREGLRADVLVLSGGVSVGDYDVVRGALEAAGVSLEFWKVQMKPGKPMSFGRVGRVPVLGLPGNPVSAWITFELFVRPGLRKMLGDPEPRRPRLRVTLEAPLRRRAGRTEFVRARLVHRGQALPVAHLLPRQGSGDVSSLVGVDALVVVPAACTHVSPGEPLEAILLRR
jgi:molybdopterin molybdotransferase